MLFKIIENNFEQGYQREVCELAYLDRAKEHCMLMALDFVIQKEGINYLQRKNIYSNKINIGKGYSLVKHETPFYIKITVFKKEPNGYFLNGALIKITQFITIKVNIQAPDVRESLFEMNIYFDDVMTQLLNIQPLFEHLDETIVLLT